MSEPYWTKERVEALPPSAGTDAALALLARAEAAEAAVEGLLARAEVAETVVEALFRALDHAVDSLDRASDLSGRLAEGSQRMALKLAERVLATPAELELVGYVAVESGMLAIVDPCVPWQGGHSTRSVGLYDALCDAGIGRTVDNGDYVATGLPDGDVHVRWPRSNKHVEMFGMVLRTMGGDGYYPVRVERSAGGVVSRIVVDVEHDVSAVRAQPVVPA